MVNLDLLMHDVLTYYNHNFTSNIVIINEFHLSSPFLQLFDPLLLPLFTHSLHPFHPPHPYHHSTSQHVT